MERVDEDQVAQRFLVGLRWGLFLPLENSIVNQLRPLVESLLLDKASNIYDHFKLSTVQNLWSDHLNKKADYSNHLWSLLMLELWIREYIKK